MDYLIGYNNDYGKFMKDGQKIYRAHFSLGQWSKRSFRKAGDAISYRERFFAEYRRLTFNLVLAAAGYTSERTNQ